MHLRRIASPAPHPLTLPSFPAGKTSKPAMEADGGSGSLDENLKCNICLSLCERPVTVSEDLEGTVIEAREAPPHPLHRLI